MSDPENRVKVRLEFEATGESWDAIEAYTIEDSFLVDSDAWSITVFDDADPASLRRKFLPLTPIRLFYGDRLQLIGHIEDTVDAGPSGRSLRVSGRDYLARLVDPVIDPAIEITGAMTLEAALLEALRPYGITEIETSVDAVRSRRLGPVSYEERAVDVSAYQEALRAAAAISGGAGGSSLAQASALATAGSLEGATVKVAVAEALADFTPKKHSEEGVLEWCQRLCARQGLTVQPGSKRSAIAVVAPDFNRAPLYQFVRPGNLQEARASRSWSGLPTVANVSGRKVTAGREAEGKFKRLNIAGDDSELGLWSIPECKRIMEAGRAVIGRKPRNEVGDPLDWYCPVYYRDDEAKSEEQLDKSARRTMAEKTRKTLTYRVTVQSHVAENDAVYATNVMATVKDAISDIDETLWVMSRTLTFEGGENTRLELIRPASYIL